MYVSVTYFKTKSWWASLLFGIHAMRSNGQAYQSKGIISVQAWAQSKNEFCTLTHWDSKEAMLSFRNSGSHLKAMKISGKLGHGYTRGWESDRKWNKEEALYRLEAKTNLSILAV